MGLPKLSLFVLVLALCGSAQTGTAAELVYRIQQGDTLFKIHRDLGACPIFPSVEETKRRNPALRDRYLQVGQPIRFDQDDLPDPTRYRVIGNSLTILKSPRHRCLAESRPIPSHIKNNQDGYLFYRIRRHDQLGRILNRLGLRPLWGVKGTVRATHRLNTGRSEERGNLIRVGTALLLPVKSLPPSSDYLVTADREVRFGSTQDQRLARVPSQAEANNESRAPAAASSETIEEEAAVSAPSRMKLLDFRLSEVFVAVPSKGSSFSFQMGWHPQWNFDSFYARTGLTLSLLKGKNGNFLVSGYELGVGIRLSGVFTEVFGGAQTWIGNVGTLGLLGANIGIDRTSPIFPSFLKPVGFLDHFFIGYRLTTGQVSHQVSLGLGISL